MPTKNEPVLTVRVPQGMMDDLRAAAKTLDQPISGIVRDAILVWLAFVNGNLEEEA